MCTLIWNCIMVLEEANFLLIFFLLEERFDYRQKFKDVFKCLRKKIG